MPIDIVGIVPVLWYLHLAPVCPLWWGSGEGRVISDTLICLWCSVGCSVDSRLCRGDLNIHHIYQKDTLVHVESAAKVVSPRQLPMVFQNPGWQWCLLVLFQCYSSYFSVTRPISYKVEHWIRYCYCVVIFSSGCWVDIFDTYNIYTHIVWKPWVLYVDVSSLDL